MIEENVVSAANTTHRTTIAEMERLITRRGLHAGAPASGLLDHPARARRRVITLRGRAMPRKTDLPEGARSGARGRASAPRSRRCAWASATTRIASAPATPIRLGGISIPHDRALVGHSDADAVAHAVTDALLGAAGEGDIGAMFPDTDPANDGRDSIEMLTLAMARCAIADGASNNIDVTVIAEAPRIAPHREAMRDALAGAHAAWIEPR